VIRQALYVRHDWNLGPPESLHLGPGSKSPACGVWAGHVAWDLIQQVGLELHVANQLDVLRDQGLDVLRVVLGCGIAISEAMASDRLAAMSRAAA